MAQLSRTKTDPSKKAFTNRKKVGRIQGGVTIYILILTPY